MIYSNTIPPEGTIRDWLDHRAEHSADETSHFFTADNSQITWKDLRNAAKVTAEYLTELGIKKGESVCICQPNSYDAIITLFGVLYGGFRATALNLAAGPAALGHAISHSKTNLVIVDPSQQHVLDAALQETSATPKQINPSDITPVSLVELHSITANDNALLMYTSGTTGLPKGVVHTHSSLLAGGWTTAVAHKLTQDDRALCVLPFFHINGLCVTLIAPLVSGGSSVVCTRFSNSRFWNDCDTYEVTWFSLVPTIISHLLHGEATPSSKTMHNVRFARSASAPLAEETQRAFEDRFDIPIVETMGLTETAAQILSNPLPPGVRKIGSPGKAFGNKVSIIDDAGNHLAANETGEVAIKGPNVMALYLDNPTATNDTFTSDGWLRTGDLGHCDADGYYFITGRSKELIIKGGENIAPREIDEALYTHKDVVEAAAFATPCPTYGQRVEAAVTLSKGSTASGDELLTLCQKKLGTFKSPDNIYILNELPKGASGKIQRMKIQDLVS